MVYIKIAQVHWKEYYCFNIEHTCCAVHPGVVTEPSHTSRKPGEAKIPAASMFLSLILTLEERKLDPRPISLMFHQFTALKPSIVSLLFCCL